MDRINNPRVAELLGNRPVAPTPSTRETPAPAELRERGAEFAGLLQDRLKVSGHAQTRLDSRGIKLGDEEWARVMQGVDKAAAKGAKESLVLLNDVALVVSVRNRTLITAVDGDSLKDNVFTNIDSAVIV